jgi:hypothetical protein
MSRIRSIDRNLASTTAEFRTFETGTDRGGKIKAYRQGSNIVRIDLTIGLSNADRTDIFYYNRGRLIFVRSKKVVYPYSEPNGFDFDKPKTVLRSDYYVTDHNLTPVRRSKNLDASTASGLMRDADYLILVLETNRRIDGQKLAR